MILSSCVAELSRPDNEEPGLFSFKNPFALVGFFWVKALHSIRNLWLDIYSVLLMREA